MHEAREIAVKFSCSAMALRREAFGRIDTGNAAGRAAYWRFSRGREFRHPHRLAAFTDMFAHLLRRGVSRGPPTMARPRAPCQLPLLFSPSCPIPRLASRISARAEAVRRGGRATHLCAHGDRRLCDPSLAETLGPAFALVTTSLQHIGSSRAARGRGRAGAARGITWRRWARPPIPVAGGVHVPCEAPTHQYPTASRRLRLRAGRDQQCGDRIGALVFMALAGDWLIRNSGVDGLRTSHGLDRASRVRP